MILTIHAVEAFQEHHSEDEVQTLAARCADVSDDEIDTVRIAANKSIRETLSGKRQMRMHRRRGEGTLQRTGQICAFGVKVKLVVPILNTRFESLEKFALEILRSPVTGSSVAPTAVLYLLNASDDGL